MCDWTDERMLEALHRHDRLGQSLDHIAQALGTTRGSIAGMFRRVRIQLAISEGADPEGFALFAREGDKS